MPLKAAKAVVIGAGAFVVTMTTLNAMTFGLFVFWASVAWQPPRALEVAVFLVFNIALVGLSVLGLVVVTSWGARRLGVSPFPGLLITAVLVGSASLWFLEQLTMVNGCVSGVAFPLGGSPYCAGSDCGSSPTSTGCR
jgi:hypothetical protein